MKFRVGDKVKLKSGGPTMRVEAALPDDKYKCSWPGECWICFAVFPGPSLKRVRRSA